MNEKEYELIRARKSIDFLINYIKSLKLDFEEHNQLSEHYNNVKDFLGCKCHEENFKKSAIQIVMDGPKKEN
jgi:hypothetical protein